MTNHGDDCYFFYYSTCTKGDSCPFRHCEAAMGSETVCNLWQEGRCFRTVCKFRHMEITKNRKEIACFWENQPAGCQKPHCAFFHEKPRYIEDVFVPPNKSMINTEVQQHEEPELPAAASLPPASNPQLRGVIKTDNQELVPSPTHPPVVINPADDDEDEDDQFSEEGEDSKVGHSPRKLPKSDESLNFGVSTLEEIRLRKALKASMKRAGYPIQSSETSTNGEKENIHSFFRPAIFEARDETGSARGSVAERLGLKIPVTDANRVAGLPLKRSLAERLGRVVDLDHSSEPPQKTLKPVKERLGRLSGSATSIQQANPTEVPKKVPEQIRIKTLEEIKQEKATKARSSKEASSFLAPGKSISKTSTVKSSKGAKQNITLKEPFVTHDSVNMFSEILRGKKRRHEKEEEQELDPSMKKTPPTQKTLVKSQQALDPTGPAAEATNVGEVRVKTLEEIRREKAERIQAQHTTKANRMCPESEDYATKRLCTNKLPVQSNVTVEKSAKVSVKPVKPATAAAHPETSIFVKVKSLEEIMREKQLRKQQVEEQAKSTGADSPHNQTAAASLNTDCPVEVSFTALGCALAPPPTAPGPDYTLSNQKVPAHNMIPLKSKTASRWKSRCVPDTAAAEALVPEEQSSSLQLLDTEPQNKKRRRSYAVLAAKQARAAPECPAVESPAAETTLSTQQKKSPQHITNTKVRPKLNVRPSVMKPAVQVNLGQKRKGAEQSAVAAVKPLTCSSTMQEETACREAAGLPSHSAEAQLSSAEPCSPTSRLDSGSTASPLREELQTVPVFKQNPSPALKTPTQPKSRRASVAASGGAPTLSTAASSSPEDDFDDLINEFTHEHLEDDMDPAIGEDDLLQELSEMIDS